MVYLREHPEVSIWDAKKSPISKLMKLPFVDTGFDRRAIGHLMAHISNILPDIAKVPPDYKGFRFEEVVAPAKVANFFQVDRSVLAADPSLYVKYVAQDGANIGSYFVDELPEVPGGYWSKLPVAQGSSKVYVPPPLMRYSGFDAMLIGEILHATGTPPAQAQLSYQQYVISRLFAPLKMAAFAGMMLEDANLALTKANEVLYTSQNLSWGAGPLPICYYPSYGFGYTDGAWAMSAVALARVISALDLGMFPYDASYNHPLFGKDYGSTVSQILEKNIARTQVKDYGDQRRGLVFFHFYDYGAGSWVSAHNGALQGGAAQVFRREDDGLTIALLVNQDLRTGRPLIAGFPSLSGVNIGNWYAMVNALPPIWNFPSYDLFSVFGFYTG